MSKAYNLDTLLADLDHGARTGAAYKGLPAKASAAIRALIRERDEARAALSPTSAVQPENGREMK